MSGILRIKRNTLLVLAAIMIAVVAVACDSAAEKPTAEPPAPTAVPTVTAVPATEDAGITDSAEGARTGGGTRAGAGAGAGNARASALSEPEIQRCLANELGLDIEGEFDRSALQGIDGETVNAAFELCGVVQGGRPPGGGGARGGFGGGGFGGGPFGDPEVQECLREELGEEFGDGEGGGFGGALRGGGDGGFNLGEDFTAALEKCGVDLAGGLGGFAGDGSFQECLTDLLGDDALNQLRNPDGAPSEDVQAAFEQCSAGIAIPVEPDGGIGDGAGPIPAEPEATGIPVSDLTTDQLVCISSELEPADLTSAVVATSSGDLSGISDEILEVLQACGIGV